MFLPWTVPSIVQILILENAAKRRFCRDMRGNRISDVSIVILAGQVLLSRV